MELSADAIKNALEGGGVPALALIVLCVLFYGFLKVFKFRAVSPNMTAFILVLIVGGVLFLLWIGMTQFSAPPQPPNFSQSGELRNLVSQLGKDPNAPLTVKLSGTDEDKDLLGRLYFEELNAPTYPALVQKMCAAKAECIKCDIADNLVTITKTGDIAPNCKVDGTNVYCCA